MKNSTRKLNFLFGKISVLSVLTLLTGALNAFSQSQVSFESDVIEWAGEGPNAAFVAIDFDADADLSAEFVFGVNFTSATITGEEALQILATQSSLAVTSQTSAFGIFVTGFEYTHNSTTYSVDGAFAPEGWSYYLGADAGTSWSLSGVGASTRILNPNDIDAWAFGQFNESIPNGPRMTPPSTLALECDVVEWIGSGPRQAFVSFDFSSSSNSEAELVFGVNFTSQTITGDDLLIALDTQSNVQITSTTSAFGIFLTGVSYTYKGTTYTANGPFTPEGWSYYLSRTATTSWDLSPVGASTRMVHHNDTDGWAFGQFAESVPNGPRQTPQPSLPTEMDVVATAGTGDRHAFVVFDFSASTTTSAEFVFPG